MDLEGHAVAVVLAEEYPRRAQLLADQASGGPRGELAASRLSNSFPTAPPLARKAGGWSRVFGSGSMVKGCAMSAESCSVPVEVVGCMEYRRAVGTLAFNPTGRDGAPGRSTVTARRSLATISYAVPETAMKT